MSDFLDRYEGRARNYIARPRISRAMDMAHDLRLRLDPRLERIRASGRQAPTQQVLVVGVEVPGRDGALREITRSIASSRHEIVISTVPMLPRGKFENVDAAIAAADRPLASFDWLLITDDDVALPQGFLDDYIAVATAADLVISQPAHCFLSHATYQITRRRLGTIARRTGFVEIGPLNLIRADAFSALIPFPRSRWSYGLDVLWADLARRFDWRVGVVDAVPIRHLRPVAGSYSMDEALAEGRQLLRAHGASIGRDEALKDYGDLL